jgi:hypothetical protein
MPYPVPLEGKALAESSVATHIVDATGVVNGARLATVCSTCSIPRLSSKALRSRRTRRPAARLSLARPQVESKTKGKRRAWLRSTHTFWVDCPSVDTFRSRTVGTFG